MRSKKQFLKEYEKLCQKYKMGLTGCGCCGSPRLSTHNDFLDEINYDEEQNKIKIRETDIDGYFEIYPEHDLIEDEEE